MAIPSFEDDRSVETRLSWRDVSLQSFHIKRRASGGLARATVARRALSLVIRCLSHHH
jgi:hypothetical protein